MQIALLNMRKYSMATSLIAKTCVLDVLRLPNWVILAKIIQNHFKCQFPDFQHAKMSLFKNWKSLRRATIIPKCHFSILENKQHTYKCISSYIKYISKLYQIWYKFDWEFTRRHPLFRGSRGSANANHWDQRKQMKPKQTTPLLACVRLPAPPHTLTLQRWIIP